MNNSVTFAGFVGADAQEIELANSDNCLAKFSLAVKQGKEETMWIDCEAWNAQAKNVLALITKGREVVVSGRLALNTYTDKNGAQVTKPVVKLLGFYLCSSHKSESSSKPRSNKRAKAS